MEASQSAATLNWIFNFFSNPLIAVLTGAIGGVIITLVTKLGEGWINEFYERRKQARTEKAKAAKDINSFCTEGMHNAFNVQPGSEHHIKLRATEIEGIDAEVGTKLRLFLNSWIQCASRGNVSDSVKDTRITMEFRNDAQRFGEELLLVARKWAN